MALTIYEVHDWDAMASNMGDDYQDRAYVVPVEVR
jgi:hypothetical protein